jgi:hypothetical protein
MIRSKIRSDAMPMNNNRLFYTDRMNPTASNDPYMLEASIMIKSRENKRLKQHILKEKRSDFLHKDRRLEDLPFMPKSDLGLWMYILFVPYAIGAIFILFYVFRGDLYRFIDIFRDYSSFLIWGIGYEIIAVSIILWVIKVLMFDFSVTQKDLKDKEPKNRRKTKIKPIAPHYTR